jgi:carboxypeptidase Taq
MSAYAALKSRRETIANLEHLEVIASWDRMVNMPPGAAADRAAALGELEALVQASEAMAADDAANLALLRRERAIARALPEELVRRTADVTSACYQAWARARPANDWAAFAAALEPLIACTRERAQRLGDALGMAPYDALLDQFDRGLTLAEVERLFAPVAAWLPDLIDRAEAGQAGKPVIEPEGPFPVEAQRRLGVAVMTLLGFDFDYGRLDVSLHPFCTGTKDDIRITTRYREDEFFSALMGIVHETGHALYNRNLPSAWRRQPLGSWCSMPMHEGQSLSYERQLGPSPGFIAALAPLLVAEFGDQPAFAQDNLRRLMTRVKRGKIRVDADEVTYPAHILLRTGIEPKLIAGEIGVSDIPAIWDEGMARLLDIDTRGDFANGPMQDIHWAQGLFGYFPSYLMGAMIAAQLAEASQAALGAPTGDDIPGFRAWLQRNVWDHGARLTTGEIMQAATGRPLCDAALRAHLEARYL